jgi:hypothetical protein
VSKKKICFADNVYLFQVIALLSGGLMICCHKMEDDDGSVYNPNNYKYKPPHSGEAQYI